MTLLTERPWTDKRRQAPGKGQVRGGEGGRELGKADEGGRARGYEKVAIGREKLKGNN